jgi:hypothetical protein
MRFPGNILKENTCVLGAMAFDSGMGAKEPRGPLKHHLQ